MSPSLSDAFWAYYNNPELLLIVAGVLAVVFAIAVYRRQTDDQ